MPTPRVRGLLELDAAYPLASRAPSARDDAVRPEGLGLALHPGHAHLPGVLHRLGRPVEFRVLAPPPHLDADVVDRAAEHQAEWAEARLANEQEFVDRQ